MTSPEPRDAGGYCREIERYLCRVNGGHLVRVVGPSFQLVNGWFEIGIPLKVVYRGIDRRLARLPDRPGARRPLRIEFCEADVLDVHAEWTRAVGRVTGLATDVVEREAADAASPKSRGPSLPAHLQRAQMKLTSLLASSRMPPALAAIVEDQIGQIDGWRTGAAALRGERRQQVIAQLEACDRQLVQAAWAAQDPAVAAGLRQEAADELSMFRSRMTPEVWEQTIEAAATRLLRERLSLPTLVLEP